MRIVEVLEENEIPLPGLPEIKEIEIPKATEPGIFFQGSAQRYQDRVTVDTELITKDLITSGFDERTANGYAIVFHDSKDVKDKNWKEKSGEYSPEGYIGRVNDKKMHYTNAFHVVISRGERSANNSFWHEAGHGHQDKVLKVNRVALYHRKKLLETTAQAGRVAEAGGFMLMMGSTVLNATHTGNSSLDIAGIIVGGNLVTAGVIMHGRPGMPLWQVDSGEIYARRFAHRHRQLRPISVSK